MVRQVMSPSTAMLLSSTYTCLYVGSVYLLPHTRVSSTSLSSSTPQDRHSSTHVEPGTVPVEAEVVNASTSDTTPRDRNHPAVIKARLMAVTISAAVSAVSVPFVVDKSLSKRAVLPSTMKLLGMALPGTWTDLFRLVCIPLGLTMSLFGGSLYVSYLCETLPGQRYGNRNEIKKEYGTLQALRNFVIGPLTEEVVFRSCLVSVSALAGLSKSQIVFLTPLYFGVAHLHHAYETYVGGGKTKKALQIGLLQTGFQFTYTTVFGWYASFLFMRTGSIIPPLLAHTFCNIMGLPPLAWALQQFPDRKLSLWSTYVAGIATFCCGLWKWTEPASFGGSVYWA